MNNKIFVFFGTFFGLPVLFYISQMRRELQRGEPLSTDFPLEVFLFSFVLGLILMFLPLDNLNEEISERASLKYTQLLYGGAAVISFLIYLYITEM